MALFSLIAKLGLDKTGFDAGLSSAQKGAMRFAAGLRSQLASAFSVAAITLYTRNLIEYASRVKDASSRTGASTDALQTMGHAAKLVGVEFETVVRAFKDLSKARQEAMDDPKSKALQVFEALGISGKRLKELKLDDLFREVGRAFGKFDFGASTQAMASKLGKSMELLLPMFIEGIDQLEERARKAGAVIRGEVIEELDAVGDEIDDLTAKLRGPFAEALVEILKLANAITDKLSAASKIGLSFVTGFQAGVQNKANAEPEFKGFKQLFVAPGRLIGRLAAGVQGGVAQIGQDAFDDLMRQIGEKAIGGVINVLLPKGLKNERPKREFHFEKVMKEKEPRAPRQIQADVLGRIGGTVGGGGDAKANEMIRELKELRKTIEVRGVRINGEL